MTQLQKAEFEILKEVIEACDTLGLRYFLVCGSALGATKYKGFVPWDDDVDIALSRDDYNVFINKAGSLLSDNLFIQNIRTDSYYPQVFSKVRNSNTAYIEKSVCNFDINHGVYIDVFPLDGYPLKKTEQFLFEVSKNIKKLQIDCTYNYSDKTKITAKTFFEFERSLGLHNHTNDIVRRYTRMLEKYPPTNSKLWCNHGNWQGKLEYAPKEQYGNGTWATFEGLKVRIPEDYDAYLTQKYGNWRADLPPEQQVGHHYAEVIDVNRPYTDYIVKLGKGKIRLKTSAELTRDGIPIPEGYKY